MSSSREKALGLYRAFLRAAHAMPTTNRRDYIRRKARDEFVKGRDAQVRVIRSGFEFELKNFMMHICQRNVKAHNHISFSIDAGPQGAEAEEMLRFAEIQLEAAQLQAAHLTRLRAQGNLKS